MKELESIMQTVYTVRIDEFKENFSQEKFWNIFKRFGTYEPKSTYVIFIDRYFDEYTYREMFVYTVKKVL